MTTNVDMGGNTLILEGVKVGATAPGQAGTDISGTELTFLDGASAANSGTSKAVITGTSGVLTIGAITAPSLTSATNLTLNATTTGTIGIGSVSTGAVTVTPRLNTSGGIVTAAGTTAVAPVTLTSGTNLTTAAAGAVEFDGTNLYFSPAASTRQVVLAEQRIILTADHDLADATIASATPMFVATGAATGAVTLAAATCYGFEGVYRISNTGTTSHTWSVLFGGAGSLTRISYVAGATTSSGQALTALSIIPVSVATAIVVTGASTSATENLTIMVRGNVVTNAGGTFIPQVLASARPGQSGTPGVTALTGSYFRIWPVGAAANIVVGNWS